MDAKTLKALKGSIKKWKAIVAGNGKDDGKENCPLCKEFADNEFCDGCPVAVDSGHSCEGSPYREWVEAFRFRNATIRVPFSDIFKATDDETVMCAVLELEYLKSLLPSKKNG